MSLKFENCDLCLKGSPGPAGSIGPEGPAVCVIFNINIEMSAAIQVYFHATFDDQVCLCLSTQEFL